MEDYRDAVIKFDSPRAVFYPGQVITGSLELNLDSPITFSVIYIKFIGEATVLWKENESETVNGTKILKEVQYDGHEEYFRGSQLLAGSHGTTTNLNTGRYSYPFYYRLPSAVPSSYRGTRGKISTFASAHVQFEGQELFGKGIVGEFDVVAPFDLNLGNARVREPMQLEFEEVYSCGCFSSGPVSVRVRVPFSGYCPGQAVPVAVRVDNASSVEISSMAFEMLKRVRYRSQRPVSEYTDPEEVLTSVKKGSIMSGSSRTFAVELVVPHMIAPDLELCSVIDVGYFIRVTIKLSGCNSDMQDEAEMCIGLIPLRETVDGTYQHPMAHSLPLDSVPDPNAPQTPPDGRQEYHEDATPGKIGFVQVHEQKTSTQPSQNNIGFNPGYQGNPGMLPANPGMPPAYPGIAQANPGMPLAYPGNPGMMPSAYPGMPSAYPGMPSAYPGNPGMPSAHPGNPGMPLANPGMPSAYPGMAPANQDLPPPYPGLGVRPADPWPNQYGMPMVPVHQNSYPANVNAPSAPPM